jgi:glycerophosphoryl diester phosphodiesterase
VPPFDAPLTVIGHRGAGAGNPDVPENSIRSFQAAHALGATWVELDVRKAADGELVVCHDERLADGTPVRSLPAADLPRKGIHRLEEVLTRLPDGLGIDLDVKNSVDDAVCPVAETTAARVARIARIARGATGDRRVLLTSFDPALRAVVETVAPELPVGLLTWAQVPLRESIPTARRLGYDVLAPWIGALRPHGIALGGSGDEVRAQVAVAHQAGLQLLVWVAGPDDVPWLAELGIEGMCVDDIQAVGGRIRALAAG